jgi:class 3 adenylate cyclase
MRRAFREPQTMAEQPDSPSPSSLVRKLATILSADVAEYSRLMAEDEEQTLVIFRAHSEVFAALVALHRGRIFNTAGDAILAEFGSVVEAVRCATEIQAALQTSNSQLAPSRQVRFRIGINLGDVMVQGSDLLGDGVNVAARLQTAAEPGGICLSGSVYDQIRNKLSLSFQPLGEKTFKNIPHPIRTFRITGTEAPDAPPAPAAPDRARFAAAPWLAVAVALLVIIVAGVYWAYSVTRHDAAGEGQVTAAPPPAGSVPSAAADAAFDGVYSGPVCYGPGANNAPGRCYRAQATVEHGKISGKWSGANAEVSMILSGVVSAAGAVQLEMHSETAEGGRRLSADLTGTLQGDRLDATGSFRNGRTVSLNWRRN